MATPISPPYHIHVHCIQEHRIVMSSAVDGFVRVAGCEVAGVAVQKFKSSRTGLVVCLAQVEGPIVEGFFCLATEAHDHDGLPHTLEHLIFMGSEKYPFKGVLDLLANRCLSQGTNAWTDVDHTCYTMTTAGSEGFLNLMPIYLDHILYPTLTDAAFLTEVHHINGDGDDAGVVYCEMQARENTCDDRTHFHLLQHFYPGRCGYKSETGGRLENLRDSCSNEKVCAYHRSYYRPDNLCLIVAGQVEPGQLFQALAPVEEKILSKGPLPSFKRPWQTPVPPLTSTVSEDVPFPTDEEDDGMVCVAWRGPSALDRYSFTAVGVLLEYLTDTPVAPLQRDLVETSDPFCSEVDSSVMENLETCIGFELSGVPMEKINSCKEKVLEVLSGIGGGQEQLDLKRLSSIIKRKIKNVLNHVEEDPHNFFAFSLIGDFLFSTTPEQFPVFLNEVPHLQQLLSEPVTFWVDLVSKYFVNGPHVAVLGKPSAELAAKMSSEEKERVCKQQECLGEEGLKERGQELDKAIAQNELPVPTEVVSELSIPRTDSIHFHPLVAMGNHRSEEALAGVTENAKFPVHKIPFFFHLYHIHSSFVELTAVLDTAVLSREQRLYLPLYIELLFESPVLRNGEVVPHETVVKELVADTVNYGAELGAGGDRFSAGSYSQAVFISVKVVAENYERGVQWLRDVLYSVQFTSERLSVVAKKMTNDVSRLRRDGKHVSKTLLRRLLYTDGCNMNLTNMVTQQDFLKSLQQKLKKKATAGDVVAAMATIREKLTAVGNLRVVMATNVHSLPHPSPLEPWSKFLQPQSNTESLSPSSLPPVLPRREFRSPDAGGRTLLAGVGGVESNFMMLTTPTVTAADHPDLPAILVYIECLCALEGPMWRQIRGMGLSYNYRMSCSPESGQMYFQLFKSSQLVQAYKVAREIMSGYLSGSTPFDEVQLESAISGVIYEIIEREKTVSHAASNALMCYLKQVDNSHNRKLLTALSSVTIEDLKRVGGLYFSKMLEPSLVTTAVCCNPNKVQEVKEGLEMCGHKVEVVDSLNKLSVLNGNA